MPRALLLAAGAATLVVTVSTSAAAALSVTAFTCEIGGDRTHILVPREKEADSDDELACRAELAGLPPGEGAEFAAELRLEMRTGPVRVVAAGELRRMRDFAGHARLKELFVPHSTWASAVDWSERRRPRLRIVLHVYRKAISSRRSRWQLVATERIELGDRRRRR